MTENINKICYIKCNNISELNELLQFGTPGLPYVPEWVPQNLSKRKIYPSYVNMQLVSSVGPILNDIADDVPALRPNIIPLFDYDTFVNFVVPNHYK